MVALVQTVAYLGLEARSVEVQCQIAPGLPRFNVVGLPDKAVNESKERVGAALAAMGLSLPPKRITINLSPADLPKEGSHYDLPIALALLGAMGVTDAEQLGDFIAVGELALDGRIVASPGVLLAALHASSQELGLICPAVQGSEAAWASGVPVVPAPNLVSLLNHLKGVQQLAQPQPGEAEEVRFGPDLKQVKGQETAKRALEIAAAGGHNLLMIGPPGAGKSLLASCLPGVLPPLTPAEALEVSMVASVAGTLEEGRISRTRPFRSPHHSASMAALTGGGLRVRPGEVSLAHLGVLFLDELPEFQPQALDALRQPMETGDVLISRANHRVVYPARFQLVAAMNPCRCGRATEPGYACRRQPNDRCMAQYQARVSGPLLDRIDLHVEVPQLAPDELLAAPAGEASAAVRTRCVAARERALARQGTPNQALQGQVLDTHLRLDPAAAAFAGTAAARLGWSARATHRALKVARTIADLGGGQATTVAHVAEAIQMRRGLSAVQP